MIVRGDRSFNSPEERFRCFASFVLLRGDAQENGWPDPTFKRRRLCRFSQKPPNASRIAQLRESRNEIGSFLLSPKQGRLVMRGWLRGQLWKHLGLANAVILSYEWVQCNLIRLVIQFMISG